MQSQALSAHAWFIRSLALVALLALSCVAPLDAQWAPGPRAGLDLASMRTGASAEPAAASSAPSFGARTDSTLCWDCDRRRQPFISFLEMQLGMWPQWSVNNFVREGNIGDVNPAFWWRNVRGVWEWDPNSFDINQLGHPGQGSMYFNGWRTNGYGFWGSQLAALGGSFFWECCGERNLPSNNDLLTTWIGGATLGEVGRRLSDLWLDNSARGAERFQREASAFLVNPVRGFDRIFRGHAWRVGANDPTAKPQWLQGVVGLGGVALGSKRATDDGTRGGAKFAARLTYGTIDDAVGKPFDHFELEAELTSVPDAALYLVRSRGSLFGKHLRPDSSMLLWGAARYDYVRSRAFELGQQSLLLALERRRVQRDDYRLDGEIALRLVPIAAIEDDFITPFGENRNYDYAYGGGYSVGGRAVWRERAMLRWNSVYEALRVADGEASSHVVIRHEVYLQQQLGKVYGLGLGFRHQSRRTFVSPNVQSSARAPEIWLSFLRATPDWRY